MRSVGLTSVTFRQLSVDQIIALVREIMNAGIEWGSDVHIKTKAADRPRGWAAEASPANQLRIFLRQLRRN